MWSFSEAVLTLQDSELGAGVDLSHTVGGCAFVDGFVAVGPQRLDTEHRARAVIELYHLARRQQRRITVITCDNSIQTHAEPLSEHNRVGLTRKSFLICSKNKRVAR